MSHESNHFGQLGAQNPGQGADFFKKSFGASDSQAAEAAAAAARAAQSGSKS